MSNHNNQAEAHGKMTNEGSSVIDQEQDPFIRNTEVSPSIEERTRKKTIKNVAFLFSFIFLVGLALFTSIIGNDKVEVECKGNMVFSECPCWKHCSNAEGVCENACQKGCGCPADAPFLTEDFKCISTCDATSIKARDFTDCPASIDRNQKELELSHLKNSEIFHIRISPTFSCAKKEVDVLLHFTLLVYGSSCEKKPT